MTTPTAKLDQVRQLLALANNEGATEGERDTANAAAMRLMAKYMIDDAMIGARADALDDPLTERTIKLHGSYAKMQATLAHVIAESMSATIVLVTVGKGSYVVKVYGHRSDVERTEMLFTSLLLQMLRDLPKTGPTMTTERVAELARGYGWDFAQRYAAKEAKRGLVRERDGYLIGYTNRIKARLAEMRAEVTAEAAPGAALALVDRGAKAKAYQRETSGRTEIVRARSGSRNAAARGSAAADRADLGQTRVGGAGRAVAR